MKSVCMENIKYQKNEIAIHINWKNTPTFLFRKIKIYFVLLIINERLTGKIGLYIAVKS